MQNKRKAAAMVFNRPQIIKIIHIQCALLSFLSKTFVSTKWWRFKVFLSRPNLLWQGISRGNRVLTIIRRRGSEYW